MIVFDWWANVKPPPLQVLSQWVVTVSLCPAQRNQPPVHRLDLVRPPPGDVRLQAFSRLGGANIVPADRRQRYLDAPAIGRGVLPFAFPPQIEEPPLGRPVGERTGEPRRRIRGALHLKRQVEMLRAVALLGAGVHL